METLKNAKFYYCKICGNLVGMIRASGAPMTCCNEVMTELTANTQDASTEKHVPEIKVDGNKVTVTVGSVEHPMVPEHLIEWIYLATTHGGQRKTLEAGEAPTVEFALTADEKALTAYAYCNLHGLWKADV